ncbi:MAG: hypothetical protein GX442_19605 [Candidatus Riflebacteria bacterium]|nr:hypothetical protein [Candidatus Riflebacteria bacterium]
MSVVGTVTRIRVFVVLKEDCYETQFGDGYYAYFDRIFPHLETAEDFVTRQSNKDFRYHLRPMTLEIEGEKISLTGELRENEVVKADQVVAALEAIPGKG